VWVVQPDCNVDYCSSTLGGSTLYQALGAQPFNYTDAIDALPNTIKAFGNDAAVSSPNGFINASGLFESPGADGLQTTTASGAATGQGAGGLSVSLGKDFVWGGTGGNNEFQSTVSDAGTFVLAETSLNMHCWGENPVVTAKLQLNGQDRFSEREGTYFDQVQPWQHHTRSPDTGINVYSFALQPEQHQPSGTCNFSRIDNATLQLVLSNATVSGTNTAKVRVYARNYNVLRIMSGMGGLAYSN
jgi:hypothetical protein